MDEKNICIGTNGYRYFIAFLCGVIMSVGIICFCYGWHKNAVQQNPIGTVNDVREQQQQTANEIGRVEDGISNASTAASAVSTRVENGRRIAEHNAERITHISGIVGECQRIVEENRRIFEQARVPDK